MIKRSFTLSTRTRAAMLACALIVCIVSRQVNCQDISVAVLLQQTPSGAGIVIPDPGVHHYALNTEVVLTAVPGAGYEFMYWLGDVGNPTSSRTIAYIDKPKIIVAVFQQAEHQMRQITGGGAGSSRAGRGQGAGSELFTVSVDVSQAQGSISGGPSRRRSGTGTEAEGPGPGPPVEPPEPPEPPVPEPATAVLLLAGSMFALAKRGARTQNGKVKAQK